MNRRLWLSVLTLIIALAVVPFGIQQVNGKRKASETAKVTATAIAAANRAAYIARTGYATFEEAKRNDPTHNFATLEDAKTFTRMFAGTSLLQCPSGSVIPGTTYVANECLAGCSNYCQTWYYDAGGGWWYSVNTCGCVEGP